MKTNAENTTGEYQRLTERAEPDVQIINCRKYNAQRQSFQAFAYHFYANGCQTEFMYEDPAS